MLENFVRTKQMDVCLVPDTRISAQKMMVIHLTVASNVLLNGPCSALIVNSRAEATQLLSFSPMPRISVKEQQPTHGSRIPSNFIAE